MSDIDIFNQYIAVYTDIVQLQTSNTDINLHQLMPIYVMMEWTHYGRGKRKKLNNVSVDYFADDLDWTD